MHKFPDKIQRAANLKSGRLPFFDKHTEQWYWKRRPGKQTRVQTERTTGDYDPEKRQERLAERKGGKEALDYCIQPEKSVFEK